MNISSFVTSAIFTVLGFVGIAGSYYGNVIDNDYVLGFSLAFSLIGFALAIAFIIEAMNKELKGKKDEG